MNTTMNTTQLAQRHSIQDDITHVLGHLADWQEDLETGPYDDDTTAWSGRLSKVCVAQKLLRELNEFLYSLPVDQDEWEETYGDSKPYVTKGMNGSLPSYSVNAEITAKEAVDIQIKDGYHPGGYGFYGFKVENGVTTWCRGNTAD